MTMIPAAGGVKVGETGAPDPPPDHQPRTKSPNQSSDEEESYDADQDWIPADGGNGHHQDSGPASNEPIWSGYDNMKPGPSSHMGSSSVPTTSSASATEGVWGEELRLACLGNDVDSARSIINDHKVGVDYYSALSGWTPLMFAASKCSPQLVKLFLDHGADVNLQGGKCQDELTSLMICCACSSRNSDIEQVLECAQLFIQAGADINLRTYPHRMTALMFAIKENRVQLVKLLLGHGAEVNELDKDGRSALDFAAGFGYGSIVRVLLEHDANMSSVNEFGQLPGEVAYLNGHHEISTILYRLQMETDWNPEVPELSPELLAELDKCVPAAKGQSALNRFDNIQRTSIEMVLENLGLKEYLKNFEVNHKISYLKFLTLSKEELEGLGIDKVGARLRILDAIRDIHNREWVPESVIPILKSKVVNATECVLFLDNITNHLDYIRASIEYLESRTRSSPNMKEFIKAQVEVAVAVAAQDQVDQGSSSSPDHCSDPTKTKTNEITQYLKMNMESLQKLQTQAEELRRVLQNLESRAQFQVADDISKFKKRNGTIKWTLLAGAAAAASLIGLKLLKVISRESAYVLIDAFRR